MYVSGVFRKCLAFCIPTREKVASEGVFFSVCVCNHVKGCNLKLHFPWFLVHFRYYCKLIYIFFCFILLLSVFLSSQSNPSIRVCVCMCHCCAATAFLVFNSCLLFITSKFPFASNLPDIVPNGDAVILITYRNKYKKHKKAGSDTFRCFCLLHGDFSALSLQSGF